MRHRARVRPTRRPTPRMARCPFSGRPDHLRRCAKPPSPCAMPTVQRSNAARRGTSRCSRVRQARARPPRTLSQCPTTRVRSEEKVCAPIPPMRSLCRSLVPCRTAVCKDGCTRHPPREAPRECHALQSVLSRARVSDQRERLSKAGALLGREDRVRRGFVLVNSNSLS